MERAMSGAVIQAGDELALLRRRLAEKASELHQAHERLRQLYAQADVERETARRLQRAFRAPSLPGAGGLRLAVYHRNSGCLGGDLYDAFRMDESRFGLYLADAMGHGVAASLLGLFVRAQLETKETANGSYRVLAPDEVLDRLNRALLERELPDTPFLSMAYGLFDARDGTFQLARAGQPAPLHIRRDGEVEVWSGSGALLGVCAGKFACREKHLGIGDKLILYSDGLVPANAEGQPQLTTLFAAARQHRALAIQPLVEHLADDLRDQSCTQEDVTILGLERTV
ncbi:MAG: serine/threonine-protein phosphatase [Gemmataceae bacterium]|nr:serine/threonine-protein phosphatase [Gemmataceae bacterium]